MKARGTVLKPPLGIFLSPCDPATFRPQVPRTQISRPESPGMTSPSPRIQIISTDSAVASPQRIQVPAPVPLGTSHLPKGFNKELCFLGIKYNMIYSLRNKKIYIYWSKLLFQTIGMKCHFVTFVLPNWKAVCPHNKEYGTLPPLEVKSSVLLYSFFDPGRWSFQCLTFVSFRKCM